MAEDKIAVGITVWRDTVADALQLLHSMAFPDPSQISFQTRIDIWNVRLDRLIKRIVIDRTVISHNGFCVEKVDLLILFHLPEKLCRIMGIFGFGHERQLQPAHSALDGVLPLRVLHVEQIREHVHPDRAPIAVCQPALERRPRLLQHCRIWLSVILQVIHQTPQLLDLLFKIAALLIVLLEHLVDISARILYALSETFA